MQQHLFIWRAIPGGPAIVLAPSLERAREMVAARFCDCWDLADPPFGRRPGDDDDACFRRNLDLLMDSLLLEEPTGGRTDREYCYHRES